MPAVGECLDDNAVVALVEGQLSAERRDALHRHLDACDACRQLVAHSAEALVPTADSGAPPPSSPAALHEDGLRAGDRVGRYRILKRVGAGAMGVVYAAEHEELKRRVALKVVRADSGRTGDDRQLRGRLLREARAASAIRHPNVVTVHDVLELDDGSPVMVMDLLDGESLRARLERGPMTVAETVELMQSVLSALQAAHDEGVIHRDLKPDNVFLCRRRDGGHDVKLLDFGIAKLTALDGPAAATVGLTESGMLVGTPQYMAPEQAFGEAIDERVDLWAVGAMLYECIGGRRPLEGDNLGQLLKKLARLSIPYLDTVAPTAPVELVRLVHELLSERGARPRSAQTVAERLSVIDVSRVDRIEDAPRVVVAPTSSAAEMGALDSEGATFAMARVPQSWVVRVRRSPWPLVAALALTAGSFAAVVSWDAGGDVQSVAAQPPGAPAEPARAIPIATLAPTGALPTPAVAEPTASASAHAAPPPRPASRAPRAVPPAPTASSSHDDAPGNLLTTPPF